MRQFILVVVTAALTFVAAPSYAQKQYNVWFFGNGAGVDFNTTPPTPIEGHLKNVREGLATICNPRTGELLFSTDGTDILNREGRRMPNGDSLRGGYGTSTQGAIILPFPLDSHRYYVVTADQAGYEGPNTGVHYNVVDMRLDGGLGDVVEKNILLFPPPMAEKLTAVRHTNTCDIWIVSHSGKTNEYMAALLRGSAVLSLTVISPVGIAPEEHRNVHLENIGELVASTDGTRLAYIAANGYIEVVDFDRATGVVSNPLRLASNSDAFYGAAFSPDGSKLYVAAYGPTNDPLNIRQYDLSLPVAEIPDSYRFVSSNSGKNIKPGPDGNLYAITADHRGLTMIKNPNERYPACEVIEGAIPFLPQFTGRFYGMPNVSASLEGVFRPCLTPSVVLAADHGIVCAGDCIEFSATARGELKLEWIVSDGRIIRDEQVTSICFDEPGSYTVVLRGITNEGDTVTASKTLIVKPAMNFRLRSYSVVTDTIGAVIKVPIVLNDTITSVFEGEFSFDPERLDYAGTFDIEGNRIDIGSLPDEGTIRITERVERDSIVGYMFFNLYWEDTLCRSIQLKSSRLTSTSVQCLLNVADYELCLDEACGTQMFSQYLRTSQIFTSIVPNPAASSTELRTTHDLENATIALFDMNGREVLRRQTSVKAGHPETLDIVSLSEGVYFMTIVSDKGASRKTIVIQR